MTLTQTLDHVYRHFAARKNSPKSNHVETLLRLIPDVSRTDLIAALRHLEARNYCQVVIRRGRGQKARVDWHQSPVAMSRIALGIVCASQVKTAKSAVAQMEYDNAWGLSDWGGSECEAGPMVEVTLPAPAAAETTPQLTAAELDALRVVVAAVQRLVGGAQ
jgi:predicted NAD/FAD-dependent oxidoreductase